MMVWQFINSKLERAIPVVLLYVLQSEGSSPGRQDFKMAIAEDAEICGTIGGGIMEHKLVEKAKKALKEENKSIEVIPQYHDKMHPKHRSGMICSGSQHIAFVPLFEEYLETVSTICETLDNGKAGVLTITSSGLSFSEKTNSSESSLNVPKFKLEDKWHYQKVIGQKPSIHIIGAGHVGLALSEIMSFLGFYVKIYDDREGLNTLEENDFAHEKHILPYSEIGEIIKENKLDAVVIVTFGYQKDKVVFKQLLGREFAYLGMMGSQTKIEALFKELENEGHDPKSWKHVYAPIGLPILSKTAKEIAISIAAQVIRELRMKE